MEVPLEELQMETTKKAIAETLRAMGFGVKYDRKAKIYKYTGKV